jgi:hypothetical protein
MSQQEDQVMKKLTLIPWAVALAALVSSPARAAIVYSGSQNVVLKLNPMSPMDSQTIQLAGDREDWDDFRIDLWLEGDAMGMMTMTMYPMGMMSMFPTLGMGMGTKLAIFAPGGMGMAKGMGAVLGHQSFASRLAMGMAINPDFGFVNGVYLHGSGEFGEDGGYIGLLTAMGQYGWLHMLRQSDIGTDTHSVVFDGWAYEEQPGVPIVAGQGATCDWVRGRPHKMHWPQLPDLSRMGIDISLEKTALADDFKCTETGPITDIHIWASFRDDILPKEGAGSLKLELSIYSDIPATEKSGSRPGELLWTRTFAKGEYSVRRVNDGPEDWYDPATGAYTPGNHRGAWQYNFCIGKDPFTQKEGTIYWLVVRDLSADGNHALGWKTTSPKLTWNDSAVSDTAGWTSLAYPKSHEYAMEPLGLAFVITNDSSEEKPAYDLGDAPDSSNTIPGANMQAYPGVPANFPTVYQAGSPPYGPLHRQPLALYFLGQWVSLETEADVGLDADGMNNLDPLNDAADRDGGDDGLRLPLVLPACQMTTVDYVVTATSPQPTRAYVNIWCDWNRDGDWDDVMLCPDGAQAPEWAVQNQVISIPAAGTYPFTSPAFRCWHPTKEGAEPLWVRITLAEREHLPTVLVPGTPAGVEGAGPMEGYQYGETEDYLVQPQTEPPAVKYDWGDAPETAAAAGYPTSAASDGARHEPVGPWLGDDRDMPDSEPDGQPDPNALGDNLNASDDENGASIPPLVPGEPESATVRVNGGGGVVQAWIDFNRDRSWQDSEKIYDGFLPDGVHVLPFTTPNTAVPGWTFARFRISTEGGLKVTGPAQDGEVEDHEVRIEPAPTSDKTWCQRPDLTPYGIDIRVDSGDGIPRVLADDFGCRAPGRLTHIRLWGSWRGDQKGEIKKIRLRIYGDDPVGVEGYDQKNKFSKPRPEVLWEKEYLTGQFTETLYHTVGIAGEWWWDPASGKALPGGDTQVWRLDMDVPSSEAFAQDGTPDNPRIYWLAVEAEAAGGEFGWKTRRWPEHFMDDAVWDGVPDVPRTWEELRYPAGHRFFEHEYNSIDMAFCLLFQTSTTPMATSQPVAVTQCPPVETTCPALLTTCPMVETECPSAPTKCPVVATQCPAALTKCPPTPTECQTGQTVCPAVETRCPAVETKCPPVSTKCPEALTKCPPTATQCQVVETECPVVDTRCPPVQTKCPESPTKCPPTATQCQTVDTQCPVAETRCPPVETKCPAVATKCPEALTKCPPTATQCQVVETECPVVDTRCPPVNTKCPPTTTKCPEVLTQCPPTATQCQTIVTECPIVETRCPTEQTKCPPAATQCPVVLTQCPPTATQCQTVVTECPITETRCPVEKTKCPPEATQCPVVLTQCPPTATQCQTVVTECPITETRCPVEETKCPPISTQCPAALTKCPPTVSACQVVETQCPAAQTQCPPVQTECPAVSTECPTSLTKCPATLSRCLVIETQCPTLQTQCPPVETECPAASTQCPRTVTRCPPVQTQCPICIVIGAPGTNTQGNDPLVVECPAVEALCPTISDYLAFAVGVR